MNDVTFNILKIVISVVAALVGYYLIPYIKAVTLNEKHQKLLEIVEIAVRAAEQTIGSGKGELKKDEVVTYVTRWMVDHGYSVTEEQLSQLIEAAVFNMKREY